MWNSQKGTYGSKALLGYHEGKDPRPDPAQLFNFDQVYNKLVDFRVIHSQN